MGVSTESRKVCYLALEQHAGPHVQQHFTGVFSLMLDGKLGVKTGHPSQRGKELGKRSVCGRGGVGGYGRN